LNNFIHHKSGSNEYKDKQTNITKLTLSSTHWQLMELAKMWLGIRAMICRWHHANCFVSHTLQFVGGHLWGIRKPTSDDRFFCLRRKKWAVSTDVGCIQWRVAVSEPTVDTR